MSRTAIEDMAANGEVAKVIPLRMEDPRRKSRPRPDLHSEPGVASPVTSITDRIDAAEGPGFIDGVRNALADKISGTAAFLRRRITGDYPIDEFGYDEDLAESVILPALRPTYQHWFRVEVSGIENIPEHGGALLVANHAGVIPIDGLMTQVAVHDNHPKHRPLRMLAADLVFETPMLGTAARKAGHTLACNADAERLLRNGELTAVFPEGFKGVGKSFARPLQAAAVRPRRVRVRGGAHRRADHPVLDRRGPRRSTRRSVISHRWRDCSGCRTSR